MTCGDVEWQTAKAFLKKRLAVCYLFIDLNKNQLYFLPNRLPDISTSIVLLILYRVSFTPHESLVYLRRGAVLFHGICFHVDGSNI